MGPAYDKEVLTPNGGYCVQRAQSNVWHCHNTYSIGINLEFFLEPKEVSFHRLEFKEGATTADMNGWYLNKFNRDFPHPEWPNWYSIGSGNSATGCQVNLVQGANLGDCAWLGHANPLPYDDGGFTWEIPWLYTADNGVTYTRFHVMPQILTIDASGHATVEKGGVNDDNNHGDPSQALGGGNPAGRPTPC